MGSPLYKIDTEGYVAPSTDKKEESAPVAPPPTPSVAPSAPNTRTHPSGKSSLIHFTGKRSLIAQPSHKSPTGTSAPVSAAKPPPGVSPAGLKVWSAVDMEDYDAAWLGRPRLSAAEIEAVQSGGASIVWGN